MTEICRPSQIPQYICATPHKNMHHIGTEICTFLFRSSVLWDIGQAHCGICEIGLFEPHQGAQIWCNPVLNSRVDVHDINMWGQWFYQAWIRCKRVGSMALIHWGRVTHMRVTIIGCDNDLSPGRSQAIISANPTILSIGHLRTNFNELFIEIDIFSFKKIHLKMSSGKWRPFCLGLNVLTSPRDRHTSLIKIPSGLRGRGLKHTWLNHCKTISQCKIKVCVYVLFRQSITWSCFARSIHFFTCMAIRKSICCISG